MLLSDVATVYYSFHSRKMFHILLDFLEMALILSQLVFHLVVWQVNGVDFRPVYIECASKHIDFDAH